MKKTAEVSTRGGINFCGALTILFIGLKIASVIDWPWYLVLLPVWAPCGAAVIMVTCTAIVLAVEDELE